MWITGDALPMLTLQTAYAYDGDGNISSPETKAGEKNPRKAFVWAAERRFCFLCLWQGFDGPEQYSGKLKKSNKPDANADKLAERIGGESCVIFSKDPIGRWEKSILSVWGYSWWVGY